MRRSAFYLLVLTVVSITLATLAGPARDASTEDRGAKAIPGLLDIDDYDIGEVLEGDGPPLEHFAPDAFQAAPSVLQQGDIPAPSGYPVNFDDYPDPEELLAFLDHLEENFPRLVENYPLGQSWQGRELRGVRLTNELAPDPIDHRPAMYIDGQHHARELIGGATALYTLWWLAEHHGKDPLATHLLDTRAFYFIPSVNVDGNHIVMTQNQGLRKTANPSCCDDDGDGAFDEDDYEGHGYGTERLTEYTFDEDWANANPANPFVQGWRDQLIGEPRFAGIYTGVFGGPRVEVPQFDTDNDDAMQEDPVGGTDANRNYAWFWDDGETRPPSGSFRGPEVFSEPATQAVRDFTAELELSAMISYHSGIDLLLFPWGYSPDVELPDARWYELLARKGSQLTEANGFQGTVRTWTAQGLYGATGSTMDYFYGERGALSFSPEVWGGSSTSSIQRLGATGVFSVGQGTAYGFNPMPAEILPTVDRWNRFALYLAAATPNLELNVLQMDGESLLITVGSEGVMPISLDATLTGVGGQVLQLPVDDSRTYHAEQISWRVHPDDLAASGNRLYIESTLETGTKPHRAERAGWTFNVGSDGTLTLTEGQLREFTDLSIYFEDGWWAGDEWNDERYRCPPQARNCPPQIFATPPVAPQAGPTPTVLPKMLERPEQGPIYLPFLAMKQ